MSGFSVPQFGFLYQGSPAAGGSVYVYQTGTTTPVLIYSDAGLTTPLSNPLTLDSNGQCKFYVGGTVSLRLDGYTSTGVLIESIDPVFPVGGVSTANITGGTIDNTVIGGVTPAAGTFTTLQSNTPAQGNSSTNSATTAFFGQNLPGGFINKIRNGQMNIAQRGTSGTITAGSPDYTLDGYIVSATTANIPWSQGGAFLLPSGISLPSKLLLTGAATNTDVSVKQRIEGSIAAPLSGQTCTFQAVINNVTGVTLTPTITIKHAGSANNWGAPVTDVNAASLSPINNNSTSVVAYTFACNPNSYLGLEITLDFGALNSNAKTIGTAAWDLRVTPGVATGINTNPPPPEFMPITASLLMNQRYFNSTFGNGVTPAQNTTFVGAIQAQPYGASAGELYAQWYFPVQMRVAPTIITYNPGASNVNWRDKTGSSDVTVSVDPDSAIGVAGVVIGSQTTALTAGHRCYIHATASAEL